MLRTGLLLSIASLLAACGGGTSPNPPSATAGSATASPSVAPSATNTVAATAAATATAVSNTFAACTNPIPAYHGHPPAADNGPVGACEAAQLLFPPAGGMACAPPSGQTYQASSNCPVTDPLAMAFDNNPLSGPGGGANPVCRCQNVYDHATFAVKGPDPNDPTRYTVRATLDFGSATQVLDLVVIGTAAGDFVDDTLCPNDNPATSIRTPQPAAC